MAPLYPDEDEAREHDEDLARPPSALDAYAHVEGLVGEESVLLEQAEADQKDEHRARLKAVSSELDRAWEALRRRAERRAKPSS